MKRSSRSIVIAVVRYLVRAFDDAKVSALLAARPFRAELPLGIDRTKRIAAVLILAGAAGCAPVTFRPTKLPEPVSAEAKSCGEVFESVDRAVVESGASDGMAAPVDGFPYLRVNRFLASYAKDDLNDAQFRDWVQRMAALALKSYEIETSNLSEERRKQLTQRLRRLDPEYSSPRSAVANCSARLAKLDLAAPARRQRLREVARMPDEYLTWQRIVGLYWITQVPFAAGVEGWHQRAQETFNRPISELSVAGVLIDYMPPRNADTIDVRPILVRSSNNPLGIPDPHGQDRDALFRAFAPIFIVDTAGDWDRPGRLGWDGNEVPTVTVGNPLVYRRVSHTRYKGHALLQLNYGIWFTERPKSKGWDILGGHLDGVIWRVTLSPDGEVLMFDSIHQCGCYHQFFPTPLASLKRSCETLEESAFVPQTLPRVAPGTRVSVRLASGTHYIDRIIVGKPSSGASVLYEFEEDDVLRSMPLAGGGTKSVFRPDGVVPGSERAERYFFWPMGVPEPGAMREWGRHATAFIGRRHFDDADVIERDFELRLQ